MQKAAPFPAQLEVRVFRSHEEAEAHAAASRQHIPQSERLMLVRNLVVEHAQIFGTDPVVPGPLRSTARLIRRQG